MLSKTSDMKNKKENLYQNTKIIERRNCVASVRERTIPTEQPPLVSEVSANTVLK
jgi:hypothetical protein